MPPAHALVDWPSAPLTESLVRKGLAAVKPPPLIDSKLPGEFSKLIQWSTYDAIEHELTLSQPETVLSSSYTIRKALIRKHYLAHCIQSYVAKHPGSILDVSVPRTWDLDISFADELDEKWADELFDLGQELDDSEPGERWWILKPGMADRGNGIRLFDSKEALQRIFEEFEGDLDEEVENETPAEGENAEVVEATGHDTGVVTSQLRHFVIQVLAFGSRLSTCNLNCCVGISIIPIIARPKPSTVKRTLVDGVPGKPPWAQSQHFPRLSMSLQPTHTICS